MNDERKNTDRELYREPQEDGSKGGYYEDYVFVTEQGAIGMCSGGTCVVRKIAKWLPKSLSSTHTVDRWNDQSPLYENIEGAGGIAKQHKKELVDERRKQKEEIAKGGLWGKGIKDLEKDLEKDVKTMMEYHRENCEHPDCDCRALYKEATEPKVETCEFYASEGKMRCFGPSDICGGEDVKRAGMKVTSVNYYTKEETDKWRSKILTIIKSMDHMGFQKESLDFLSHHSGA